MKKLPDVDDLYLGVPDDALSRIQASTKMISPLARQFGIGKEALSEETEETEDPEWVLENVDPDDDFETDQSVHHLYLDNRLIITEMNSGRIEYESYDSDEEVEQAWVDLQD